VELFVLEPADYFLIIMESTVVVGVLVVIVLALAIRSRYPELTSEGWLVICTGLISIIFHGIFDVLDTLKWNIDYMTDWLNVFDGLTFVAGIALLALGTWQIANYGAKKWGL
jgi:hypothetical protein